MNFFEISKKENFFLEIMNFLKFYIYIYYFFFFLGLSQGGKCIYALSVGLTRRGIPTKVPLVLSTGKVSHWKANNKSDYKTNYKNHNWPKRKQSLQIQGKENYNF